MQKKLPVKLRGTVAHESREQQWQFGTEDFRESVAAMAERRRPKFHGK
jgi:enoyl-CoA hydratase/carnithine racemase